MSRKIVVTAALTGSADTPRRNPAVPVTPAQIAAEAIAAAKAGAAVVHVHVRDPQTGAPSRELAHYREVVERVRDDAQDVVINLTTGPGARFVPDEADPRRGGPGTTLALPEDRVAHVLELKPEICTLDVATFNFGDQAFINTPAHLQAMAALVQGAGVKPELEVFDLGHARLAAHMVATGAIARPPMVQICLGIPWGAPATTASMLAIRELLPDDTVWAAFGISRHQFPMAAQAAILGGHVRVGLEDNLYLRKGEPASGNAALVAHAVTILEALDFEVASAAEARALLLGGEASGGRDA